MNKPVNVSKLLNEERKQLLLELQQYENTKKEKLGKIPSYVLDILLVIKDRINNGEFEDIKTEIEDELSRLSLDTYEEAAQNAIPRKRGRQPGS